MKQKTLLVIYNLSGDSPPSVDTYLALSTREELEYDMLRGVQQGGSNRGVRGQSRKMKDVQELELRKTPAM